MAILRLVPLSGGAVVEIARDQVLLGRDVSCDVVVSDGSVSRRHARIEKRGATWFVVDQASANGTFVDSRRVADSELRDGQEIRFGAVGYRVEILSSTDQTVATAAPGSEATVIESAPLAEPPPPLAPASAPAAAPRQPLPPAGAPPRPYSPAPGRRPSHPGSPVPPMAPPPERKGRGPLFWIAGGCGGCLVTSLLVVGACATFFVSMSKAPADAAKAELADLKANRIDQAYSRLSESYRARVSRDDFAMFVDSSPALRTATDSSFWSRSVHNDDARLSGKLSTPSGSVSVAFTLVKEQGAWRVQRMRINGLEPGDRDDSRESETTRDHGNSD